MPEAPTAAELEIPDAAIRATYGDPLAERSTNKMARRILELGSPAVVAAELRRIADDTDQAVRRVRRFLDSRPTRDDGSEQPDIARVTAPGSPNTGWALTAADLRALLAGCDHRARADELDPPARQED